MSHQNPDEFDEELHSLFARAAAHIDPRHDLAASVQHRLAQGGAINSAGGHRSLSIAAMLSIFLVVALLAGVFAEFGRLGLRSSGGPGTGTPIATTAPTTPAPTPTATAMPFTVTGVDLTVDPASIAEKACGSTASFTYTAIFHIPAHTAGGVIQFSYTLNNGRSQTPATVTAGPNETSATFTFTSSGALTADHTYPGPALVMVTSPNTIVSSAALPSGSCGAPTAAGPFQVTSVAMAVNPASIAGTRCGSSLTVTYTATFHLAANGPGGTIRFSYTLNNGRGSTPASVTVAPGQTTATYQFQWSGALPADHTYPAPGGVMVQSPNALTSSLVGPSGACS